uniref:Reverse transcriptase domain-containing protein n=1 Tax=Tanacetum cinerariifolium TaxID=118510 RepID=A0A6L2ND07_TANCI|nr:reverse transcriptase domain-containing protein [Tanacetum cinerariifolium]GEV36579.1 reverse transcriptase domain-containing protein [Tanacetum cinerariifolium]GEV38283.1 reverse transcriptase domain-containing protein [Tanacetum cinerariifolium]
MGFKGIAKVAKGLFLGCDQSLDCRGGGEAAPDGNLLNRTPRDALTIVENKSNDIVKGLVLMNKATQQATVKAIEETCVTCGGPHPYYECLATGGNTFDAYATVRTYNQGVDNPKGAVKTITNRSGFAYKGPLIPPTSFSLLSFADALLHMLKFASTFKSLLSNKEKLFKLASTPLNENCLAALLKKFLEKLRYPDNVLIPYDFLELEECLALDDLGASINLMPLSVWKKLSLPELTPTCMTLKHANRSVTYPVGVAKDVFVNVGKTTQALINVYSEELTLRVNDEAITFKVGHTLRYSHYYYEESVNQFNVIDAACEEYAQEVLGFSDSSTSGNPTPSDPIIATSSPSFTPFEGSDFIGRDIYFSTYPDELSKLDDDYYDTKGDILYCEKSLNEDPSLNLPSMKNEDLKQVDVTMTKPLIEELPELELKDLPSHLEYAFLEGTDKLPVIISKELKDKEKATLLKVLKSHKWAIARKIFDIKGIDPHFYTHKILMEDDFKLAVQHQRRIPIDPQYQENTTFTCPYGTFAYRHMPFGLCNAPGTFQRCMMAIFHDIIEETMVVFMDDFLVFGDSFSSCLSHLDKMLKRYEDTNLVLNWEKCHFIVKEGNVLSHKISKSGIEFDMAKVDVIAKLPHPTSIKGVRIF